MPDIEPVLYEGMSEDLRERLLDGRLDLALVALPYPADGLASAALLEEPFVLAVPAGHPLDVPAPATLDDILTEPLLLLSQGHCLRDHIMQACRLTEGAAVQATSMTTLLLMVRSGLGATLVPAAAVRPAEGVRFRAFGAPAPRRQIGLWWRPGAARLEAIERVAALIPPLAAPLSSAPPMPGPPPRLTATRG